MIYCLVYDDYANPRVNGYDHGHDYDYVNDGHVFYLCFDQLDYF